MAENRQKYNKNPRSEMRYDQNSELNRNNIFYRRNSIDAPFDAHLDEVHFDLIKEETEHKTALIFNSITRPFSTNNG